MVTYRVMSVNVDGASYYNHEFSTFQQAVEFADARQVWSDSTEIGRAYGYHYIVYLKPDRGEGRAMYRTKAAV